MIAMQTSSPVATLLDSYKTLLESMDWEIIRLRELERRRDEVYREYSELLAEALRWESGL